MTGDARFTTALPYAFAGAGAGYLYYVAANFQYQARAGTLGPDFWPQAILALVIAVCAYKTIQIIVSGGPAHDAGGVPEDTVEDSAGKPAGVGPAGAPLENHPWVLLAGMGATLLYVAAVQKLGFFLTTVVYLAAFMVLGGYRRWGVVAGVSIVGTLLLLFFFMKVVYVSLPIGQEPFAQVTLALMKMMGIR